MKIILCCYVFVYASVEVGEMVEKKRCSERKRE